MENKKDGWIQVESSNLAGAKYHPEKKELEIKFKNGGHYRYEGVEPDCFAHFVASESKGSFFHTQIRSKYKFAKLEPTPQTEPTGLPVAPSKEP